MAPTIYSEILAKNIKALRSRAGIEQETAAVRMRNLGFTEWVRQTVSKVERGERRVTAEEAYGLAFVLDTTLSQLLAPREEDAVVEFRADGPPIPVETMQLSAMGQWVHGAFRWDDDNPVFLKSPPIVVNIAAQRLAGGGPPVRRAGG